MTSLARKLRAFEKFHDRLMFLSVLMFGTMLPFYLSRLALQWTQVHLPLIAHIVVLFILFTLVLTWAWMITGESVSFAASMMA